MPSAQGPTHFNGSSMNGEMIGSGDVLCSFQYRDVLRIGIIVGQGPAVLAIGAGRDDCSYF